MRYRLMSNNTKGGMETTALQSGGTEMIKEKQNKADGDLVGCVCGGVSLTPVCLGRPTGAWTLVNRQIRGLLIGPAGESEKEKLGVSLKIWV